MRLNEHSGSGLEAVVGQIAANFAWKTYREDDTAFPGSDHPSAHTLATGESCRDVLMKVVRLNGEFSWININTNPVFHEGSASPSAVVVTFSDISGRKKAEEELKQKIGELERFNNLTMDREVRMIELKTEVNALLKQSGQPEKYWIAE